MREVCRDCAGYQQEELLVSQMNFMRMKIAR